MLKKYVIVGGSSGIGLSLVKMLYEENDDIFVLSRTWNSNELSDRVKYFEVDILSSSISWPDIGIDQIDGLVYMPGTIRLKPFTRISKAEFQEDLELNVFGAIGAIQHFLPLLKKAGGSIVLISTVAVSTGLQFHTSVALAKGALEGLAISLAAELAPTIRVNVIAPSLVATPLAERFLSSPEKIHAAEKRHALQKIGEPEDIANMIHFLLDNKGKWITGQVLRVDGGMSSIKNT